MAMKTTGLTRKQDLACSPEPPRATGEGRLREADTTCLKLLSAAVERTHCAKVAVYFCPILHSLAKLNGDKTNLAAGLKITYLA
jgi:hypothetical protein